MNINSSDEAILFRAKINSWTVWFCCLTGFLMFIFFSYLRFSYQINVVLEPFQKDILLFCSIVFYLLAFCFRFFLKRFFLILKSDSLRTEEFDNNSEILLHRKERLLTYVAGFLFGSEVFSCVYFWIVNDKMICIVAILSYIGLLFALWPSKIRIDEYYFDLKTKSNVP